MRQGGMKPKGHGSGIYWTRAHGGGGRKKTAKATPQEPVDPNVTYDSDGDGKADLIGWILHAPAPECPTWVARIIVLGVLIWIGIKYS